MGRRGRRKPKYAGAGKKDEVLLANDPRTIREKNLALFDEAHSVYMRDVAGDEIYLATVIAHGRMKHREAFSHGFRNFAPFNRVEIADRTFDFFRMKWFQTDLSKMFGGDAAKALDGIELIMPPTQQEIDDAWEWESASSEDAMRKLYPERSSRRYIKGPLPLSQQVKEALERQGDVTKPKVTH